MLETDIDLRHCWLSSFILKDFPRTCTINQYDSPIFLKREEGGEERTEPEILEFALFPTTVYVFALEQKPQRSQISCTHLDWN